MKNMMNKATEKVNNLAVRGYIMAVLPPFLWPP